MEALAAHFTTLPPPRAEMPQADTPDYAPHSQAETPHYTLYAQAHTPHNAPHANVAPQHGAHASPHASSPRMDPYASAVPDYPQASSPQPRHAASVASSPYPPSRPESAAGSDAPPVPSSYVTLDQSFHAATAANLHTQHSGTSLAYPASGVSMSYGAPPRFASTVWQHGQHGQEHGQHAHLGPNARPGPPPPLPPGWQEWLDPTSGKPYWAHDDGRSTWTRPLPLGQPPPPQGPPAGPPSRGYAYPSVMMQGSLAASPPSVGASVGPALSVAAPPSVAPLAAPQRMDSYLSGAQPTFGERPGSEPSSLDFSIAYMSNFEPQGSRLSEMASVLGAGGDGVASGLRLELSATGLRNLDWRGQSDPVVLVRMQDDRARWYKIGQSEVINNNLNPHWRRQIPVNYRFEKVQLLRFDVFDVDRVSRDGRTVTKMEFLGQLTRALGDLVAAGSSQTYDLSGRTGDSTRAANYGRFCVRVHEASQSMHRVSLKLRAAKLEKADGFFRKSDPYVKIKQVFGAGQSGSYFLYKSEYIRQDLNPEWKKMEFDVPTNGRTLDEVKLELELVDYDEGKPHDPLGSVHCTLSELVSPGAGPFDIINKHNRVYIKNREKYKNSGQVFVERTPRATVVEYPSHVAYLRGGCKINVMCAVDMTHTGGDPTTPSSPHFTDGRHPSMYSLALRALGDVLTPFLPDDNMIHAYGFGASHAYSDGAVSHAFPLNCNAFGTTDARVEGKANLVAAYESCVKVVQLGHVTKFAEIISLAIENSTRELPTQDKQHYTLLIILTSGGLTDMEQTVRKICLASETAPLSIVIVGVGDRYDWSDMIRLDGDKEKLRSHDGGVTIKRDIVDFVKYNTLDSAEQLAADVMREVPEALREYFVEHDIKPNATVEAAPTMRSPPTSPL